LSRTHDVHLLEEGNEDLSDGLRTALGMMYSPDRKREVTELIERFKPDLIHVHNVYPALGPAVHLAAAEAAVPLVMTVHNYRLRCPNGYRFTEGAVCNRCMKGVYAHAMLHRCFPSVKQSAAYASALWVHRFLVRLSSKVAAFLTPSGFVCDWLVREGIEASRVSVVPNFVESRSEANARVGEYGVYIGRLSSEKGLDVLLRALAAAGDPPFRIVGDGPEETRLLALREEVGLENTTFEGRLRPDEVDPLVRHSRYLVMPALSDENCPMSALEAMSLGRPLLVTRRGGLPELVRNENGLICRPGDPADMAASLRRLVDDPDLCERAGQRGLDLHARSFTPQAHLELLESAYRACLTA
jgi:glycosyltransferase involved in cell wall biosynthesis